MSAFVNNDITAAGLMILAKGQIGEKIKYTRIVLGDGYMPPDTLPRDMMAAVNEIVSLEINKCRVIGDGTAVIGGYFTNEAIPTGFFYRELALYAEDPDVGEVLYCYGNAGDLAEWIPPNGYPTLVEKAVDIVTVVGAATNVTAVIASGIYVTYSELERILGEYNIQPPTATASVIISDEQPGEVYSQWLKPMGGISITAALGGAVGTPNGGCGEHYPVISDTRPEGNPSVWLKPTGSGNISGLDNNVQPVNLSGVYISDIPPDNKNVIWATSSPLT